MLPIGNLIQKSKNLETEIDTLQMFIEEIDEKYGEKSSLIARKNGRGGYEYSKKIITADGSKKEVYLPVSAKKEIEDLAYKNYAKRRLIDAKKEKHFVQDELELRQSESHVSMYLRSHPGVAQLLQNKNILQFNESLTEEETERRLQAILWNKMAYPKSTENSRNLTIPTGVPNLYVRSKSEALIVGRFEYFGVAYHYEELYVSDKNVWLPAGISFHPDFKCINIRSGKVFWWEHQGQWDNPEYTRNLAKREAYLYSMGLVPWKNLIITTETADEPLDLDWVDWIIKYYLL